MEITGKITSIEYQVHSNATLQEIELEDFDINTIPAYCLLNIGNIKIGLSKWVSPKRTRSYPYERVYNTLVTGKKVTVIPVVKDEGAKGDRDFLQWDTVALMSLLDVYVILAYYSKAERRVSSSGKEKITNQQFDNTFILSQIKNITHYHSSALHWNLRQIQQLPLLVQQVKKSYAKISTQTGVKLKSEKGIDRFLSKIGKGAKAFMKFSRAKAKEAQSREFVTQQPKEALSTLSKAKITIQNYLGGLYFFTVDEIHRADDTLQLIEAKHTKNGKIPSKGDIKDGLLKLILYTNLENVKIGGKQYKTAPVLKLTSSKMTGRLTSNDTTKQQNKWFEDNKLTKADQYFLIHLFKESKMNNFKVLLEPA